jgi:E3 ubiquitin-protein ligase RNF5
MQQQQPEWMARALQQPPAAASSTTSAAAMATAVATAAAAAEEVSGSIGENFECNICFQKANEAVLTCCGHLFCWPCLYRWVHVHSYHKECPVCKGSIAECSITPIYGRESALVSARMQASLGGSDQQVVPPRPQARRIESARQQREREDREREREERELQAIRDSEARDLRFNLEDHTHQDSEIHQSQEQQMRDRHHQQQQQQQRDDHHLRPGLGSPAASPPETLSRPESTELDQHGQEGAGGIRMGARDDEQQLAEEEEQVQDAAAAHHHHQFLPGLSSRSSGPGRYYQRRRMQAYRREQQQLRQALTASSTSPRNNSNVLLGEPMMSHENLVEDRQQMLTAAAALLSQEWEDIINISHLVVNPVQVSSFYRW